MSQSSQLTLNPTRVLGVLLLIIGGLLVAHVIGQWVRFTAGAQYGRAVVQLFNFDHEGNLPAYFSAILLGIGALLFLCAWRASGTVGRPERFWLLLAWVFLFLGIDEACVLHEHLGLPISRLLPTTFGGTLRFAWVIPFGVLAVVLAVMSIPVFRRIGARLASLMALSGVLYLVGAVGFEMIEGRFLEFTQRSSEHAGVGYVVLTTIEETLEMLGLAVLVYTLLSLIQEKYGGFALAVPAVPVTAIESPSPAMPPVPTVSESQANPAALRYGIRGS